MNKKKRSVEALKKLGEIIELVKVDAVDNLQTLKKVTQKGEVNFNAQRKVTQEIDGELKTNATAEARSAKQSTQLVCEKKRCTSDSASSTENGNKTDSAKDTKSEGCPVSMVTGEELLQLDDVTLPGMLPFTFSRTYRTSSCETNRQLGYGWSHSLSHTLAFEGDTLFWRDAEGKRTELPIPTQTRPEIYNDLAGAAVFLGEEDNEYILVQRGEPFHHFIRQGDTAWLSALSDSYDNRLSVHYDQHKRLRYIKSQAGLALWFFYEHSNTSLITRIDYRRLPNNSDYHDWETECTLFYYHYNDASQLIQALNGAKEGETYRYDIHNVISLRKMAGGVEFGWQWQGEGKHVRCVEHWSNTGYHSKFEWQDADNAVTVTYSDGSQSVFRHDNNAKLVEQTDPDGALTRHEYNEDGNLTLTVDPLGNETRHIYNEYRQRVLTLQPDGEVIEFQYWMGNLRRVIHNKHNWRYKYNDQGDIIEKRDPLGRDTFYRYNKYGRLVEVTHPDGSKHKLDWNLLGKLVEQIYPDGSVVNYRHDIHGRVIEETAPDGSQTHYQWDSSDRLIKITHPNGSSKSFTYNGYGKPTSVTDENGHTTTYQYHANTDLVSQVTHPDGTALRYQYDNPKNFVSKIINEREEAYQIDYYPNGLVKQETTFDGRRFNYEYDLTGKLTKKIETGTQGSTLETVFERDVMGRLIKKTLPDGQTVDYCYDGYGQLIEVNDGETPLAWRYDLLGRLTQEHQGWASNYYEYNLSGHLAKWQLPDANVIEYQHNQSGQLSQILINDDILTKHRYRHGLEKARKQGDIISQYQHDEQGRLMVHTQHQQEQLTQSRHYRYHKDGNLAEMTDSRYGFCRYEYDPLSRLKEVTGNTQQESLFHDVAGNLVWQGDIYTNGGADVKGNQLYSHDDKRYPDKQCSYQYDEFGRVISEKRGNTKPRITRYEYDCQHRLIKTQLPDGKQATYKYDAFGRRVSKTVTDHSGQQTTTEFLWQGDNLIAETDNKAHYQTYLYEPDSFKPLALISGRGKEHKVYHYHLDQIGTPTDLTDTAGNSVWSMQYYAYGRLYLKHKEDIHNPLRFQGQYFDAESGLHYNRHRYYNPNNGRFITADPIGLAGGLNNYQYVKSPTGWVDPLGLADVPMACACSDGNTSFLASGSTIYHGEHSTAIGSDPATLGNFQQAIDTGNGHNVIVHGSRPDYDSQGGIFFVDGNATHTQQIVDALLSNPDYKPGSPVCLGSCWSGSNGTAQELAKAINAPVTAPTRPVRFNQNSGQWEQMSDAMMMRRYADLIHIKPEMKKFNP